MLGYSRIRGGLLAAGLLSCALCASVSAEEQTPPAEGESVSVVLAESVRPPEAELAGPADDEQAVEVEGLTDEGAALIELPVNDTPQGADHPVYHLRPEPFSEGGAVLLTLDEIMSLTLENNVSLGLQEYSIEKQHFTVDQSYYAFDPSYNANLSYSMRNLGGTSGAVQGGLASSEGLSGSFSYNLPREYGDSFSFSYDMNRSALGFRGEDETDIPTTYGAGFSIDYERPLMRGAGKYINRIPRFQASNSLLLSYEQLDDQTRSLKAQVLDTYFRAVSARRTITVREESLEVALQQLERAVERYKVGLAIRADVLQAENSVLTQRSALLAARTAYRDLLDTLTTLSGLPQEIEISVDPSGTLIELGSVLPEDLWTLVECNSFDLKSLRTQLANLRLSREALAEQLEPNLGLSLSYGRSGEDESIGSAVTGYENESYSVGLNWSGNQGERSAKADVAKAELDIASIDLQIQQAELELKGSLRTLQRDLETKLNQLQLARSNLIVVEETYNIISERHNVGLATMLDVVEAQEDVLAAELAVLQAQVAYQETYRQIQLLAGLL